MDLPTHLNTK